MQPIENLRASVAIGVFVITLRIYPASAQSREAEPAQPAPQTEQLPPQSILATQPSPPMPMPAVLRNYQPVTAERLKNPEDGNWLMIRRTYNGWGYSPLNQITAQNVARLRP